MTYAARSEPQRKWRRYSAVGVVGFVLLLNHTDRLVLGILVEPIRSEFALSDGQLGLLTGPAFALVYALLVIPIARFAERHNRVAIVTISLLVWSAATVACGLAGGFVSLLVARLLVGCGEAGGIAPSMSVVSDIFPARQRASAMAIFALGASLAVVIAPMVGGALLSIVGWRGALVALGLIGLPAALLLFFGVPEPQRGGPEGLARPAPVQLEWRSAIVRLFRRRSYALLVLGFVFVTLAQFALLLWLPAFFQRSYATSPAELGLMLGLFQGVPILAGNLAGGLCADWLARRDRRWLAWLPMLGALVSAPIMLGLFAIRSETFAFILLIIPSFLQGLALAPSYALLQNLAAIHSRATATAVLAFCVSLIGTGLGPLLIGALSQLLSGPFGEDSLRYAFFAICPLYALAGAVFWVMSRHVVSDMLDAEDDVGTRPVRAAKA